MKPNINIHHANIVDVINGCINFDKNIYVRDGIISDITSSNHTPANIHTHTTIQDVDANGLWVIPGLIDCHVHIIEDFDKTTATFFEESEDFSISLSRAEKNIASALSVGVTTMRDVGAYDGRNNKIRDIINKNLPKYKFRLVSCGRHITVENGHRSITGVKWDYQTNLADLVAQEIIHGADFIKVMNDDIIFNLEQLRTISQKCHEHGVKLACHAFTESAIQLALDAQVDTIEHGYPINLQMALRMAQQGTFLCPTFVAAYDTINDLDAQPSLIKAYPDCTFDEFRFWYNQLKSNLRLAFENNVNVITGTDAGTPPTDFKSLPREIILLSELGATNLQALRASTINAAQALGLEKIIGSIEIGKSADMVLLQHNPLDNIKQAIVEVRKTFSQGYPIT